jgi:hypothetical protein
MVRPIAFYLPQFHPIPENDAWWGKGFTEWTNVAKAQPLFEGHYQPHVPADLGFYDLRLPESRQAQAALARQYGIEGFCYYHYWFGNGRRILERPFDEVLASGQPDFPFCLCWANQSWTGVWYGAPSRILIEQTYPGDDDARAHFRHLLPALRDPRYIQVDGKPVLLIFDISTLPDRIHFVELWRRCALEAGLPGLHLLAIRHSAATWNPHRFGFDGAVDMRIPFHARTAVNLQDQPEILDHREIARQELLSPQEGVEHYPCVGPSWDNSPRSATNAVIYTHSSPDLFKQTVKRASSILRAKPANRQLLFIKAWNEWAEGNHLEPDLKYGLQWLEALKDGIAD